MYAIPRRLNARGLVRQSLLMAVEPEINDLPNTKRVDIFELRFGRLTRRSDPIVEPTVINRFRVGHEIPSHHRRDPAGDDSPGPSLVKLASGYEPAPTFGAAGTWP